MKLLDRIVPWLPIGCLTAATGLVGYAWASIAAVDNRPWANVAMETMGAMAPVLCIGGTTLLVVSACAVCKLKQAVMSEANDEDGIIQTNPHGLPTCVRCRLRQKLLEEQIKTPQLTSQAAAIECIKSDCGFLIVMHLPDCNVSCRLTSIVQDMPKSDAIKLLQWALPPEFQDSLHLTTSVG